MATDALQGSLALLDRLRGRAIQSDDDRARCRYIDAADIIILDLLQCGLLDQTATDDLAQSWVGEYARLRARRTGEAPLTSYATH